ncbi:MAG: fatty acid desaturase family protein [Pseudomonadota bacterium]|nr:fatty acid desaturase family protein [Pseudomonadota bacterium]
MNTQTTPSIKRPRDVLSAEQIGALTARSDIRGLWAVISTWIVIAATFTVMAIWPNPLTIFFGAWMLAGRQLALAILQHEAAHGTLFRSRMLNDVLGDWACARPIWLDMHKYRAHHLRHHAHTGLDGDPDLSLSAPFPVTRRSLARKLLRDITGYTGLKVMLGHVLMAAGIIRWTVANDIERLPPDGRNGLDRLMLTLRNLGPTLLFHAALFALLWSLGQAWMFALWMLAYLAPFALLLRLRSLAEHACTEAVGDAFRNTRTTHAGWLARMTVAPMRVNYHIEHHFMASVPYYRLPELHSLLREKGLFETLPGYLDVLRTVSAKPV